MFGLGSSESFEIDGIEFTIERSSSARKICKDGEVLKEIDKKASVVPAEISLEGETYNVMLIFDTSGNLKNAYAQGEDGKTREVN